MRGFNSRYIQSSCVYFYRDVGVLGSVRCNVMLFYFGIRYDKHFYSKIIAVVFKRWRYLHFFMFSSIKDSFKTAYKVRHQRLKFQPRSSRSKGECSQFLLLKQENKIYIFVSDHFIVITCLSSFVKVDNNSTFRLTDL